MPYDSHHINLKVPSYTNEDEPTHQNRLLGITSSPNQTAEGQAEDTVEKIDDALSMYNKTPLAKRSKHFANLVRVISLLMGANTDHCSKAKKYSAAMEDRKIDATHQVLGEHVVLEKTLDEIEPLFDQGWDNMIKDAGGQQAWNALSKDEQALQHAIMVKKTLISLGEDKYAELSEEEQRELDFFIWVGCGCHKNLNSVSGGNKAMIDLWEEIGATGPILLANKDNTAVLKNVKSTDDLTPAEQHALEKSTRGGVKAASIAGAIFNHKDDKKGQQDMFKWWFEQAGIPMMFPNTSSNRYGTYCEAGAVLFQHCQKFLEFLEYVKDSKKTPGFTNMEKNLYNALQDPPTLSELAVLALYAQAISHPYMAQIRGHDINMLNLGPLHLKVEQHIKAVIEKPELLISPNASFTTGTMDGRKWYNPDAMDAILKEVSELPHLKDLLVRFFEGALETWKRFTTEFTPGGVIDEATDMQKELAWMPATNDVNEGILGSFRQFM